MGSHSLLQGIFLTQGSNPGLLHCRQILYHLSYQGSHANTEFTMFKAKNPKTSTHQETTSELTWSSMSYRELWDSLRATWHWKAEKKDAWRVNGLQNHTPCYLSFNLGECKGKKKKECVNKGPETMLNISKLCKESLKKHSWEVTSTKQIASSVLCIL